MISEQIIKKVKNLQQLAEAYGIMKKDIKTGMFKNIKITYLPYLCQQKTIESLNSAHKIWQKLVWLASQDSQLINHIYQSLRDIDPMIQNLLNIYNEANHLQLNHLTFDFVRTDYFQDNQTHQPKIIQYNFQAVSMAGLSQKFSQVKELCKKNCSNKLKIQKKNNCCNNDDTINSSLISNKPASFFVQTLHKFYQQYKLLGCILMVIQPNQSNVMDQRALQIPLLKKGYSFYKATFQQIQQNCQVDQNYNLYYKQQLVAIVYYRNGYKPQDYISKRGGNQCWKAKRKLQLNKAIKIPWVGGDLANQKRVQVQLSKPQIYRQYLTEQQSILLKKTLVKTWDFDNENLHDQILNQIQQIGIQNIVIKPNKQGGSNNVYGSKAYSFIKNLTKKQRKAYIAMQKIIPPISKNILISQNIQEIQTVSQISKYGIIISKDKKIIDNLSQGYLVRTKPANQDQGGIMAGVGALGYLSVGL